jgi:hypothetical protein
VFLNLEHREFENLLQAPARFTSGIEEFGAPAQWRENCSRSPEYSVRQEGGPMLTSGLAGILGTVFYGSLAVVSMYLLGQLLPVFYIFVSEGL